jgi:tRNA pseudouridine55 synthase
MSLGPMKEMEGVLLVDKPKGLTSHDVVYRLRRKLSMKKIGHAGTLDPMATGLLVLGVNRATRLLTYLVGVDKTYTATIRLGQGTTTDDAEGEVVTSPGAADVDPAALGDAARALTGPIAQVPSSVSAIKVDGRRAYARVRAGEQVELAAREVLIHTFDLGEPRRTLAVDGTAVLDVDAVVDCSSGTYVRALARDLGASLGSAGHLTALRRTRVSPFTLEDAATLEQHADGLRLLDVSAALRRLFPTRVLTADEADAVRHGRAIEPDGSETGLVAAFDPDGRGIALLQHRDERIRPVLVLDPA